MTEVSSEDRGFRDPEERGLREGEELLTQFIRHSPIYAYIKEVTPAESRVLYASENYEQMIGIPGSRMVGKTMYELFPADFAARITADDWDVVSGGKVLTLEEELGHRSYTTIKFPIVLGGKRLLAGYTIDVTDRRRAELEALEAQHRFRLLAEATSEGVVIIDGGRILECNERYASMHGYTVAELIGKDISELVTEESKEILRDRHRRELTGRFEGTALRKDGSTFAIEAEARMVPYEGRTVRITAVRDLTGQRRAEAEIGRVNRLYAALIQINHAIVRLQGPEELFREVSRVLVETGGFGMAWIGWRDEASSRVLVLASHGDVTGYLDGLVVFSDERPEGRGPTGTAIREGRPCVCNDFIGDPRTLPWREKARRAAWRASAAFPIRGEGGTPGALTVYSFEEGFFGDREVALLEETAADISFALEYLQHEAERTRAEAEVRELNAELEKRVEERTAQLAAANRELEAFSYSVSHDLRAPLRAIEGFAGMLEKDGLDHLTPEDRHRIDVVRVNARKMSTLIDDLLAFSRTGRHELRRGRVAMKLLARSAFEEIVPDPGERARIGFRSGDLPDAEGDAGLIRQVWLNLLSNAVKFSARREAPSIEVDGAEEGDFVVYRVRDNGVGFDPKYAHKLFGVFQRLHAVTDFEGTGIGLALVRRIVERHGGQVRAEGEIEGGSTFSFSLPARAGP